jgi:WD40 repeat protein/DNA-directed RNA polymerase subunit RPC12/RpoP
MPLRLTCPKCKATFRAEKQVRGKKARCKKCGGTLVVKDDRSPDASVSSQSPTPLEGSDALSRSRNGEGKRVGLIIGVAAGLGLLLVAGPLMVLFLMRSTPSSLPAVVSQSADSQSRLEKPLEASPSPTDKLIADSTAAAPDSPLEKPTEVTRPQKEENTVLPEAPKKEPPKSTPGLSAESTKARPEAAKQISGARRPYGFGVTSVTFSPDGKTLASSGIGSIKLWDPITGKNTLSPFQAYLEGSGSPVYEVAFSPDGKTLASVGWHTGRGWGSYDEAIKLWDVATGKVNGHLGKADVQDRVAFSPDGKILVSRSTDHEAYVWDRLTGIKSASLRDKLYCWGDYLALSPDSKLLASPSEEGAIQLWSVPAGKPIATLKGHAYRPRSLAFSRDGKLLGHGEHQR